MKAVEEAAPGKLTDADKQVVKDKCAAEMSWLDANSLADKEEFEHHLKELQKSCSPIMTKMHGGGSNSGASNGGGSNDTAGASKGPTVEEVD